MENNIYKKNDTKSVVPHIIYTELLKNKSLIYINNLNKSGIYR